MSENKSNELRVRKIKAINALGLRTYGQMTYMTRSELMAMNTEVQRNYYDGKTIDGVSIDHKLMDTVDQCAIELGFTPREYRLDFVFRWELEFDDHVFTADDGEGMKKYYSKDCTWKCPSCLQFCTPEHGCPDCDLMPTGMLGRVIL